MKSDPLATYEGDVKGLKATKPAEGEQLETQSQDSQRYVEHLQTEQDRPRQRHRRHPRHHLQVVLNGFSADLSGEQVDALRASKDVIGVYPDEIRHPDAQTSTDYLGLGDDRKGRGACGSRPAGSRKPERASCRRDRHRHRPRAPLVRGQEDQKQKKQHNRNKGAQPYTDGTYVYFDKSDGGQFQAAMVEGQDWDKSDYSSKLIGGQYFYAGAEAAGSISSMTTSRRATATATAPTPRAPQRATSRSRPASRTSISARSRSRAAAAKISAYKACYVGPDTTVTTDDICARRAT